LRGKIGLLQATSLCSPFNFIEIIFPLFQFFSTLIEGERGKGKGEEEIAFQG
jgi:hypothetical protein